MRARRDPFLCRLESQALKAKVSWDGKTSGFNGMCVCASHLIDIGIQHTHRQAQIKLHAGSEGSTYILRKEGGPNQKTTVLNTMWRASTLDLG
jgi:hypothetical protein